MNHSKYGLNAPFYKWLDEVRRAMRREKELLQKLEYYNVKFMGYQGITYDRIGSSSNSNSKGDQNMLYWLDKIDEVEKQLERIDVLLTGFRGFLSILEDIERSLIDEMIQQKQKPNQVCLNLGMDKWRYHQLVNQITRKWMAK